MLDTFELPTNYKDIFNEILEKLPDDKKEILNNLIEQFKNKRSILNILKKEYAFLLTENIPHILILGPPNVGKTTLLKALIGETKNVLRKLIDDENYIDNVFKVTDTPGFKDFFDLSSCDYIEEYTKNASLIILVFNVMYNITEESKKFYKFLKEKNENVIVVLNNMDKLPKDELYFKIIEAEKVLNTEVIPISARYGKNIKKIFSIIINSNLPLIFSLGEKIPELREELSNRRIRKGVLKSVLVTSNPLPIADVFPLLAIQIALVLEISKIYGKEITAKRAKEIISTITGGIFFRTLFRQFSKLIPGAGICLNIGIGASGTYAIGKAAQYYFSQKENVHEKELKDIYKRELKKYLKEKKEDKSEN